MNNESKAQETKHAAVIKAGDDRFWTGTDLSFSPRDAHFYEDQTSAKVAEVLVKSKFHGDARIEEHFLVVEAEAQRDN